MTAKKTSKKSGPPGLSTTKDVGTQEDKNNLTSNQLTDAQFPIVGIGASAGGLAAFEAFFSGIPADIEPQMAFVLVQHLAPDHTSLLSELVQHYTHLKVVEVMDGMQVQINCVYIIPPNYDMAFLNATLQLMDPVEPRGHRLPIDFLFRSLALDQQERAIGIVLSGTGSDGTLGARAIKSEGGMVMAQRVDASEFDGMPSSVIATGLVDYELAPAEMPAQLMAYVEHAFHRPKGLDLTPLPFKENSLQKIFILLRNHTGHDFSQYKTNTVYRRIERRMAVHQLDDLENYIKYLQKSPSEIEALFQDLLIGVTHFFRDPDAFMQLEQQIIPKLLATKNASSVIRVWCTGCSTGEEAYSIAILMYEQLEHLKQHIKVQLFATDIDNRAIATARAGVYSPSVVKDISPERLARFFTIEADGITYRVHKKIRDLLIFSEHNLIKDPPFSRVDLISCRNLLIYMNSELQKSVISLFHYALNPNGLLFLGTSETVGEFSHLFTILDRKMKMYQRKVEFKNAKPTIAHQFLSQAAETDFLRFPNNPSHPISKAPMSTKLSPREITERTLLEQCSPTCALVNGMGDIFYLHGRTGMFLEPSPGESGINNILKMAREGLDRDLTTHLYRVVTRKQPSSIHNLRVKTNGHFSQVSVDIFPVLQESFNTQEPPLFLIVFKVDAKVDQKKAQTTFNVIESNKDNKDANAKIAELNEELTAKDEYLRAANEELETANEELKSANEEMQSVNEELQSTNEELETSKEELQSINEELATVNTELQIKVNDLSRANNDMNNLLAGSGIGTIFVDHDLRILRFTPAATAIINLILSDVGRPVAHIASNLIGHDHLIADVKSVLETLIAKETDVETVDHHWYTMRILPYRTLDNIIEGVVITFVNITEMVRIREALRKANESLLINATQERNTI